MPFPSAALLSLQATPRIQTFSKLFLGSDRALPPQSTAAACTQFVSQFHHLCHPPPACSHLSSVVCFAKHERLFAPPLDESPCPLLRCGPILGENRSGTSLPFIWPPPEHLQTPPPFEEPVLPSPPPSSLLERETKLDALRSGQVRSGVAFPHAWYQARSAFMQRSPGGNERNCITSRGGGGRESDKWEVLLPPSVRLLAAAARLVFCGARLAVCLSILCERWAFRNKLRPQQVWHVLLLK